ncbi:hypothetical protein CLPUN_38160 [Clostridium puniceum]|uniref:Polyketide cyclase / dehydrase and lipid transport n=1 Tax=Clostridium puniceum TaxID=29367 RepID=A0A1S8TAE8_9CLOT|nr:DUF3284 domain-containing protein [Clostridium puniceum]OOM74574.1 hypothetical protein CLPUN_38160 [Clostridium puniceum]
MKAVGIVQYELEDVFHIFMKNAQKDFSDFNQENPVGCKIKKNIQSVGSKPIECTIEITDYIKNEKYQITTSTNFTTGASSCVSTYMFKAQKDGTTKIIIEEDQGSEKFISYMTLWLQRFLAKRNFKAKMNNIVESLNNELKTYFSNIERSKPKNNDIED